MKQREIRFRAWDKKTKTMGEVSNMDWTTEGWSVCCFEKGMHYGRILMQYTGLKDRNGREIYEGDIVKYRWMSGFECEEEGWQDKGMERVGTVEFRNGEFRPREDSSLPDDGYDAWRTHSFEIIGNIYENGELLNEDKR